MMMRLEQSVEWELEGELEGKTEVRIETLLQCKIGPPLILHDLTWDRTQAAEVGIRQIKA
jgi:hypothetical protein